MTKQEAFNKVWQHFVIEKNPASYDTNRGLCLYRGPNGAKCAFGLLIPDEKYKEYFENKSAHVIIGMLEMPYSVEDLRFFNDLQSCHDGPATSEGKDFHQEIEIRLTDFAKQYDLYIPMYKQRIEKWLETLESDKYKQGKYALLTLDKNNRLCFCCLGVAEDIKGTTWKHDGVRYCFFSKNNFSTMTFEARDYYGLTDATGRFIIPDNSNYPFVDESPCALASLNDHGKSFQEIAQVIRWGMKTPTSEMFIPAVYKELASE